MTPIHALTPKQLEQAFQNNGMGIRGEAGTSGGIEVIESIELKPCGKVMYTVTYGDDGSFSGPDERFHCKVFVWWCNETLRILADT